MNDYFVFILAERAVFSSDRMGRKLKVSRASFYRWRFPKMLMSTRTQVCHGELDAHVVRVFTREMGLVGRNQITTILAQEGVPIARA